MCGITGFLDTAISTSTEDLSNIVTRMSDKIAHRGPDDSGLWTDAEAGIALGFRRLAIIDLTPTGHQPMQSFDGRYVLVFNGEIYNFKSLRDELSNLGHEFKGTSDTEVILTAILQWGLLTAIQLLNGMFAFALWDRKMRTLSLVRDHLGIKPLYFGWAGNTFIFGSELKALRAHPGFHAQIDRNALTLFLRYGYIPAPYTIYQGINKLAPASIMTIQSDFPPNKEASIKGIKTFWSAIETVKDGIKNPYIGNDEEAIDDLETILTRSIGLRMVADVPLGAFLSGGIDSSLIVALMQKQSSQPVHTFTIGFNEAGFDEAKYAKAVARHLQTDHTELYISPAETIAVIPKLPTLYDEPFADPSQIPTFLVSQLARQHVTVSLSGDGGDELFGGYNRYFWTKKLWDKVGWTPSIIRKWLSMGLTSITPQAWGQILKFSNYPNPGDKVIKFAKVLELPNAESIYLDLVSQWKNPSGTVINGHEPLVPLTDHINWLTTQNLSEWMMSLDLISYLPDDILAKVDRASMGTSLEARAPFLDDHETVEFAWKLPLKMKIRDGQGKWILRQILNRHVPNNLINRPKMGFGVPIDSWLRGPLSAWAANLLDEKRLFQEGFFHPGEIVKKWSEHLSGTRNWQYDLWNVLMFQAWLEENH